MSEPTLIDEVRSCALCAPRLPLEPRPIVQFAPTSDVLVIAQAPGRKAHDSGVPFADASGDRLAEWMGIDQATLHDPSKVALVSMGLCYPGKASGGDKPPRPECAPTWHPRIFATLPSDRITLLVGTYAQAAYLPAWRGLSMRTRIARWRECAPANWPLPHPAWRSALFMRDNPWFEAELLPALRRTISSRIG